MGDITEIFDQIDPGDEDALDRLLPVVYQEMRKLAQGKLFREAAHHSLQTTALVHEAYLRLVGSSRPWKGKAYFFAAAGEAMRRILVERARSRAYDQRGRQVRGRELQRSEPQLEPPAEDVLALHEVLDRFAEKHPAKADVVKLRFFAGFTTREAAEALEIIPRTAERHWAFARAWLLREMKK